MISFDLTGKVAIVTGASQGLGIEFLTCLAEYGADVAIMARRMDKLQEVAKEAVEKTGRKIVPIQLDVTDMSSIDRAVKKTLDEFGRIDILVNNAGVIEYGDSSVHTYEQWNKVISADLTGSFFMAQAVYQQYMKEHGGKIVNISSVGGVRASAIAPSYAIAKAGVIQMTKCMAVTWAKDNVFVNAIAPGQIMLGMGENTPADRVEEFAAKVPQKRLGGHDDLNGALLYLASDACRFTQGQNIVVDGGMTLPL